MKTCIGRLTLAVVLSFMAPSLTHAQSQAQADATFPTRPVTLVVPFTANSGSDIIARVIGPRLAQRWGQPVVVDNKPGASGNIGSNQVAKAAPDGHTLLMAINTFTITPAIYKKLPFDPVSDFAPVAKLAEATFALAVNPAVPADDMRSLITYLKQNPGKANYASPGNGTPHHLAMELLKSNAGVDVVHVPYKGISGALVDLMGGQVQMMVGTLHSLQPFAETGKVRLIGISGSSRNALAPKVPTFREQGFDSMEDIDAWYGVLAPAHTPPQLITRLNSDFVAVMNTDEVKAELAKVGIRVQTGSPAQLGALIKSDLARWKKVVTDAKISAD